MAKQKLPLSTTTLPSDYRLHSRLGYRLSRMSRIMQTRLENALAPHGMNRLKWCVLSGVALEGLSSPSDLATHIGITRPATSRLLKVLEQERLIARALAEEDGRARAIRVTDLGHQKVAACRSLVDQNNLHFISKLGSADLAQLLLALDVLARDEVAELDDM